MSDFQRISIIRWAWFWICSLLVAVLCLFSCLVRVVMIQVLQIHFYGAQMPWITGKVLFAGPLYPESDFACTIVILTTFVGLAVFLQGHAKDAYLSNAPVVIALMTGAYLMLLNFCFLLPFIPVLTHLSSDPNYTSTPHAHLPDPETPPEFWLIGSIAYLIFVVIGIIVLKRKEKRLEQIGK